MDDDFTLRVISHIHTLEIVYGLLNIDSNKDKLLKDKAKDDIMYFFYLGAIDLYLESLTLEEKQKRGTIG